jgi:hypothetical protein
MLPGEYINMGCSLLSGHLFSNKQQLDIYKDSSKAIQFGFDFFNLYADCFCSDPDLESLVQRKQRPATPPFTHIPQIHWFDKDFS